MSGRDSNCDNSDSSGVEDGSNSDHSDSSGDDDDNGKMRAGIGMKLRSDAMILRCLY